MAMVRHAVEPLFATVIMESEGPWVKPDIISCVDKANMFYVRFKSVLQALDRFNRNKRMYRNRAIAEGLNAPHLLELRGKGVWYGENGHPQTTDPQKVMNIDMTKICHTVDECNIQGDLVYGTITTLNDHMWGRQMTEHVLQGKPQSFSLRALANIKRDNEGRGIVELPPHIVCYDRVSLPSHPEAYQVDGAPIKFCGPKANVVQEAWEYELDEKSAQKLVMESAAKFCVDESYNVRDLINFFEVTYESIGFTPDGHGVILKDVEDGRIYQISLENYVYDQVSDLFSDLGA